MRKLKVTCMAFAIVLGVGGAIASAPAPSCNQLQQFWDTGNGFQPAGVEGVDFVCADHWTKICTYTQNRITGQFTPCKRGEILWLR